MENELSEKSYIVIFFSYPLQVIGSKVNMAARLMMYYPGILTCDAETYEASFSRLRKQDFTAMPYIELKGLKDPGIVREYNPNSR